MVVADVVRILLFQTNARQQYPMAPIALLYTWYTRRNARDRASVARSHRWWALLPLIASLCAFACGGEPGDTKSAGVQQSLATAVYQINSGGPATGSFAADQYSNGGTTYSSPNAVSTVGVANAAPAAVYQAERFGDYSYVFGNLTAGNSYTVRLHFAEVWFSQAGSRVFNVGINGTTVLSNFDIFAAAGGANKALVEQFTTTANSNGQIVISFTNGSADQPKISGIEVLAATTPVSTLSIDSGGAAVGNFVADEDFSGGTVATTTTVISTAGVANAAPAAVYQSERYGVFTYTLPGFAAGSSHSVRLHFAEIYWTAAGSRVFNVSINGTAVLSNLDIFATAGGANKALVEQFTTTANSSGQIVVDFTNGSADQPKISGIEVQ